MQLANIPEKIVLAFATSGGKNAIPVESQIGITGGAASLEDGFPPLTMTPIDSGGIPPSGFDMNGILFELSAIIRWANAGGGFPYDAAFATDDNVNGYPMGARVLRADGQGYWFNTLDNNETDPDSGGAGWVPDFTPGVAAVTMTASNVTLTPAQYGKSIIVITGNLSANLNLIFPSIVGHWHVVDGTTGAFSITCKTSAGVGVKTSQSSSVELTSTGTETYSAATQPTQYTDEVAGSVFAILSSRARVKRFWKPADGAAWLGAFQRASASGARRIIVEGDPAYQVAGTVNMATSQAWEFEGAQIAFSPDNLVFLNAVGIDDFNIDGQLIVTGNGKTVGTAAALYVAGCNRGQVRGLIAKNIKGWGIKHDPSTPSGVARGDQIQYIGAQIHGSYYGFENTAGTGAEYCTLLAPMITGCTFAAAIAAGNTSILGGNMVDNDDGLLVLGGTNHAHGIIDGVNLNHNTGYNFKADSVTNGQTVSACHIYGDNVGGAGKIWLLNSKGICIDGGFIDAMIQNDGATGPNYLNGVMFPGSNTTIAGTQPKQMYINRCKTLVGPSALNDAAPVMVSVTKSGNQTLSAGGNTVVVLDAESIDNRDAYNITTGAFTTPTIGAQLYDVDVAFTVSAASGLTSAGSYVEVRKNGATVAYVPLSAISGTVAIAAGVIPVSLVNADVVDCRVFINAGAVTPVLAGATSRLTIRLVS